MNSGESLMIRYTFKRLLHTVPTIIGVLVLTFVLGFYGPGDPLQFQFGEQPPPNPEQLARLRHRYGLDRPFLVQLGDYVWKLLQGDMGTSIAVFKGRAVTKLLFGGRMQVSLQLGGLALLLLVLIGIPSGILAAYKHNSLLDNIIVSGAAAIQTVPVFVLAPVFMLAFSLKLGLFSKVTGWGGILDQRIILPTLVLAINPLLGVIRQTRAAVLEEMGEDYLRTARAKGLRESRVLTKHLLKNALEDL